MKKFAFTFVLTLFCMIGAQAQPRIVDKKPEKKEPTALAPVSFQAKYEGGMFGFSRKEKGTLKFDDANFRLIFFDKNNKEIFSIPYKTMIVIYPQSKAVTSTTGRVVQHVPLPGAGIAGMFIKEKRRYLIINFDDTDLGAKGTVSFKLENKELLEKVIQTLGDKAEMEPRGEAYFRPQKRQDPDQ